MSNYQYPWEEIFQDCADLITVQIRDGKNVPETFPQLYQLFESVERESRNSVTSFAKCGKSWALRAEKRRSSRICTPLSESMTRCHWSFWQRGQHFPGYPTHPGCLFGCEARSAARPTRKTHTFTISPAS